MKVLKFGGSSVGSSDSIKKVTAIIRAASENERCVVVLSALQGTTDSLIEVGKLAERGDDAFAERLADIASNHRLTIDSLFVDSDKSAVSSFVELLIGELEDIVEGIRRVRELTPKTLDRILSFGEIASSRIVSDYLSSIGIANEWLDSRTVVKTDSAHGFAAVKFAETDRLIVEKVGVSNSNIFIVPGFIGSDDGDFTTTLGRGGSDFSAAIFAAALDAEILEVWTDVSGMMTADPRFVKNVRHIPQINYREAMELSHFGAKVIYPPTIQPVMAKSIPVLIKNTFAPDDAGTLIEAESTGPEDMIRGISSIDKICVLSLEGSGMVGIPGFSKRLFDALSRAEINVILITQSSSEHSICVAIEDRLSKVAKVVVDREFENEINLGKIEPLKIEDGFSILALVGDRMKEHTGVSGKMFTTLGQNGINIHAIAQGSSERNISAIISSKDVRKAVNTLHEEFFSDGRRQINLYVFGVGTVGSRLLDQLRLQHEHLVESLKLNVRVVGLANSKKMVFDEDGIDLTDWNGRLSNSKSESVETQNAAELIVSHNLRNSIVVDVTANDKIIDIYIPLLEKSVSIVACNKVAASSAYARYAKFKELAREYNAQFLFETNVGAGLPVINTLNDLMRSGDRVHRIEAVLSGTLNFVFNHYDGTRKFADVVRQAQDEGYTEPDPRLDLSGTDVARKILILAREAGLKIEIDEIENVPFLPQSCFDGSVEDFYAEMSRQEDHFRKLLDDATSAGLKLKYIASLADGKAKVGLQSIGPDHNFANLSGKDNAVLFYTSRYSDQPLVVKGAGAGADVTAAGVFADIIRAARM